MAQQKVARLGDHSSHGGTIISSGTLVRDSRDGKLVARKGDLHSCPIPYHGITAIITASPKVRSQGKAVAAITSIAGCGAIITTGSLQTYVPMGGAAAGGVGGGGGLFIVNSPVNGVLNSLAKLG
jgi:uncharacterized Zn-binding protein involved in type VI secretion